MKTELTMDGGVLITGGATGIGFAFARKFHSAGNRVIIVGRSENALSKAANSLSGIETGVADVSVASDRERLVAEFPDISILVNNAGLQVIAPIIESAPQDIEYELTVNFLAPVLLCRAYLPHLIQRRSAAIVNVSSGLALMPRESSAMYCASKAALHSFTKALRRQLQDTNVRVFEILPPLVDTAMTAGRGKGKITPEQLAEEFWRDFTRDRYEMLIGRTKLLALINRLAPSIAEGIVRRSI